MEIPDNLQSNLLSGDLISGGVSEETRGKIAKFLLSGSAPSPRKHSAHHSAHQAAQHSAHQAALQAMHFAPNHQLALFLPAFVELTARIREDLENNLPQLLALNPSRREAAAAHLDRLAGHLPGPSTAMGSSDAAGGLRRWIDGPRSAAQTAALQTYFEEIARITLGQAILLKAWGDRGLKVWNRLDVGRLNYALSTALKSHIPLDRDGWQITRPNLYSWYRPSKIVEEQIWLSLENWRITDEGPYLLAGLLRASSHGHGSGPAAAATASHHEATSNQGYDERFFAALWECTRGAGALVESGAAAGAGKDPLKRKRYAFSPTLRDGSMIRVGPSSLTWLGMETQPFLLMVAELVQLWWGPSAPPIWSTGNGLEVHSRDQLTLALGSPKPSLVSRISEMEACDISIVLEEKTVRCNGRTAEAGRLREQLDCLPYFKKLRSATTSLGALQACVALSKLRPGGLLWWGREEPLSANEGADALAFLLDRSRFLCEWDFSEVTHGLPASVPLFPKHVYLFARESDLASRLNHRPKRITMQGQIRSHVEVPFFLADALQSVTQPQSMRGNWQIQLQTSPIPQKEYAERWPDPASQDMIRALEEFRAQSAPLASFTTIRATPHCETKDLGWSIQPGLKGLWIAAESEPRRLRAHPLPQPGTQARGAGFMVLTPDEACLTALRNYLETEWVRNWLEHHAERKGEKWILNEQVVKFIPVPVTLLQALGIASPSDPSTASSFAMPLPGEWEKLASEVAYQPALVRSKVLALPPRDEAAGRIRASLFVRASRALEQLHLTQARLLSMVTPGGKIRWNEILEILPKSESVAIGLHPRVRLSGSLPAHLPVNRVDRVKTPGPGILLATESGFTLHVGSDQPRILDMIEEQLEGIEHPTWSELAQFLKLPRNIEMAEATASDVLRSHGEQMGRVRELTDLLSACSGF